MQKDTLNRGYDNDPREKGPFSPVLSVTPFILFIELTTSMKRCEIVLLISSSSTKTAKRPGNMSAKVPQNPSNTCLLRFLEMITSSYT
jgi:hypothetical protein